MKPSTQPEYKAARGPIAWMAGNPVAANLLMFVLLFGGILCAFQIKQEVFPDFEMDKVSISVAYPGAGPEEVERGIVVAIEEAVRGLDGVDEVTSISREGGGSVTADLLLGADRQKVYQDIQQEVDRITTFPEEAERPQVTLISRRRQVLSTVLFGDVSEKALRELAEQLRDRMLQDPDITQVDITGVRPYEIGISVPRENLKQYNLTIEDISRRIQHFALELPGGGIKTQAGEILLRMKERRDFGREFHDIPIVRTESGSQVVLGDIADITDGFEDTDIYATYNNKRAVMLDVYRVGDQTPIEVSSAVKKKIREIQPSLPPGVDFTLMFDMSKVFRQRMELLLRNGLIGLTLVLLLLGVFLEARLAFWVMMGIPISFLGGLLMLPMLGVSINMISMFAFLIALGIVVDDAIVVGENVYEYHQRGRPFLEAAITGAREVAMPVTFSVLTNVVAFLPLFFIPGFVGKIWRVIPSVVVTVFLISLVECLYVLPAHLGHSGRIRSGWGRRLHTRQQRFSKWFSHLIYDRYAPFLDAVLHRRYLTVSIAVGILMLTVGYVASKRMGMVLMPRVESDFAVVTAIMPYGTPIARTEKIRQRLVHSAAAIDREHNGRQLRGIIAVIGGSHKGVSGSHVIEIFADLTDPDVRPLSTREFTRLWRKRTGEVPGMETLQFQSDHGGPGSGAAITVELSHMDSGILEQAAAELAQALGDYPIVSDIDDGVSLGKPQLNFHMRPEGLNMGLNAAEVAQQVRHAFYGAEALRQQRGRNEVKVKVRLPKAQRGSEYDLEQLLIRTPAEKDVPLREVADIHRGRAYTSIERRDGRRVISVTADVTPPKASGTILEQVTATTLPALQKKYTGLSYSFEGKQRDISESMDFLKVGFLLALFAIFAMLAIPFKSYIQPLIIMISIPFGIVGAVIGHIIMGYSLSIMSMMGIVALSGVVVNDSLVLIDFANRRRREGVNVHDAVCQAGARRFRPIMLTTLTTFGGLAPMIFESSMQARFMIPMAISLGYGILFATLITLALVPSLYLIVEDIRRWFGLHNRRPAG
jgi:multidrug efflux pump subunit AcrB